MRRAIGLCGLILSISWLSSGCGGSGAKPVPVSGILLEDGKPLAAARVTFNPVESNGRMAFGLTDSEGRFRLTTFKHNDGALPGRYKITVAVQGEIKEADVKVAHDRKEMYREMERLRNLKVHKIHDNYTNLAKTPLQAEVPVEGELRIELNKNGT
jgi:hypothetical protein